MHNGKCAGVSRTCNASWQRYTLSPIRIIVTQGWGATRRQFGVSLWIENREASLQFSPIFSRVCRKTCSRGYHHFCADLDDLNSSIDICVDFDSWNKNDAIYFVDTVVRFGLAFQFLKRPLLNSVNFSLPRKVLYLPRRTIIAWFQMNRLDLRVRHRRALYIKHFISARKCLKIGHNRAY